MRSYNAIHYGANWQGVIQVDYKLNALPVLLYTSEWHLSNDVLHLNQRESSARPAKVKSQVQSSLVCHGFGAGNGDQ